MNKILNWTIGSVFRTLGRILAYLLVGSLIALFVSKNDIKLPDILGFEIIKAKSVSITSQSYSIRHISMNNYDYLWTSYVSNGTQTQINTNTYATRGFRTKFYSSSKFDKDQSYQARVRLNSTPKGTYEATYPYTEFTCYGSISNSNYSAETSLIKTCQLVSVVIESGNNYTDYYINFTPNSNIETVQFVILWELNQPMERINIDSSSTITYDTSTQDAINSQTDSLINNQNSNTTSIINNQDSNTSDIINNQNSNTQDIIDNQNANSQAEIESQKTCYYTSQQNKQFDGYYLNSSGQLVSSNGWYVSKMINVVDAEITKVNTSGNSPSICYYNVAKELISCQTNNNVAIGGMTLPTGTAYLMYSAAKSDNRPSYKICKNGNQGLNDSLNDLNDTLNDDDTSSATSQYSSLFNDFQDTDFGLTGIITAPLNMIQSMSSGVCSPITVGGGTGLLEGVSFSLPCLGPLYQQWFPGILQIYQMFTFGIIAYKICVDVLSWVRSFRKPDEDRVEVLDL